MLKNMSHALLLLKPDLCRAIACIYDAQIPGAAPNQPVIFKTFDKTIAKNDLVVVETDTRHNMTVVKVVDVDVPVDFNSSCVVKWIIDKVDMAKYAKLAEAEKVAIDVLRKADLRKKRDEIAAAVKKDMTATELEALTFDMDAPARLGAATPNQEGDGTKPA